MRTPITPTGPHAHLYESLGLVVHQLDEPPAYDHVESRYLDPDGAYVYCPVCGQMASETWTYFVYGGSDWRIPRRSRGELSLGPPDLNEDRRTGVQVRRCGHVVDTLVYHLSPCGTLGEPPEGYCQALTDGHRLYCGWPLPCPDHG